MRRDNRGFTLVELVVSIALLAVILVPTAMFFTNSFKTQSRSAQKSSITRVAQHIMENFKNKEYLGLTKNGYELKSVIEKYMDGESELSKLSGEKLTDDDGWEYSYEGIDYNIEIEIESAIESNIGEFEIPSEFECIVDVESTGAISDDNTYVETYNIGNSFTDYIDGKSYDANYPTIVVKDGFIGNILINNDGYDDGDYKKTIRIVKEPTNPLNVYIVGTNTIIKKGQEGDGASSAQTKINVTYVGEEMPSDDEKSKSEILLNVNMTISNKSDDSVRDTFKFSFSVNYDFNEED